MSQVMSRLRPVSAVNSSQLTTSLTQSQLLTPPVSALFSTLQQQRGIVVIYYFVSAVVAVDSCHVTASSTSWSRLILIKIIVLVVTSYDRYLDILQTNQLMDKIIG